jgi:hypothetical protein
MMPIPNASEQGIKSAEQGIRSGHQGIYLPDLATAEHASVFLEATQAMLKAMSALVARGGT